MLRLTVSTEEYLMIGENVKLVFLGGTKNHLRIMVDAPKDVNIVRSTVLENQITDPEEKAKLPQYYAEPELDEKFRRKKNPDGKNAGRKDVSGNGSYAKDAEGKIFGGKGSRIIITKGNLEE